MTENGLGLGAFGNQSDLKGVADTVRNIMSQSDNHLEMHPNFTDDHFSAAADDVRQNAITLEDRNKIITNHAREAGDANLTTGNVAAFSNEVMKRIS